MTTNTTPHPADAQVIALEALAAYEAKKAGGVMENTPISETEFMSLVKWHEWQRVARVHMAGEGYAGDKEYVINAMRRRLRESLYFLDCFAGLDEPETLSEIQADIAFAESAIKYFEGQS